MKKQRRCPHGLPERVDPKFGKEHMTRIHPVLGAKVWEACK